MCFFFFLFLFLFYASFYDYMGKKDKGVFLGEFDVRFLLSLQGHCLQPRTEILRWIMESSLSKPLWEMALISNSTAPCDCWYTGGSS